MKRISWPLLVLLSTLLASSVAMGAYLSAGSATFSAWAPADGSTAANSSVTVSVRASCQAAGNSAVIRVDGAVRSTSIDYPIGHWDTDGWSDWWVVDDSRVIDVSAVAAGLADGAHTASVSVTDTAGSPSSSAWGFTVAQPPTASSFTPTSVVASLTPEIGFLVTDNSADAPAVTMTLDGSAVTPVWDSAARRFRYRPTTPLADLASHTVSVTLTDAAGNTSTSSWTFRVATVTAMQLSGMSPAPGSTTADARPAVSCEASDAVKISSGTLQVDGAAWTSVIDYPVGHWIYDDWGGSEWVVDDYTRARISGNGRVLADGPHSAKATFVNADNLATSQSWTFTVASPPSITSVAPAQGAFLTTTTPTMSVTAGDNGTIVNASLSVDATNVPLTFNPAALTYSGSPGAPLSSPATHTAVFSATDDYGLTTTKTWTFYVRSVPLTAISGLMPAGDSTVQTATPNVSVHVADAVALPPDAVALSVDGTTMPTTVNYPVGQWVSDAWDTWWQIDDYSVVDASAKTPTLIDGPHTLRASVHNSLNERTVVDWTIQVAAPPYASTYGPVPATSDLSGPIWCVIGDNTPGGVEASMTVDGIQVPAAYVAGTSRFSWTPGSPLSDMTTHTVEVSMRDAAGIPAVKTWSFRAQTHAAATWSDFMPTSGSTTAASSPAISVKAADEADIASASARVDGKTVPVTTEYFVGHWQYDPYVDPVWVVDDWRQALLTAAAGQLTDGQHTVTVAETNARGYSDSATWSFSVSCPPTITPVSPLPGADTSQTAPVILADVSDNSSVPVTATVTVDGSIVPCSIDTAGHLTVISPTLGDDAWHTVNIRATDDGGLVATRDWAFRVQTRADMTVSADCSASGCHATYPNAHPTANCAACHDPARSGHGGGVSAPLASCNCHGSGPHGGATLATRTCTSCHAVSWPAIPRHPASIEASHSSGISASADCHGCHVESLTREHNRYVGSGGVRYDCQTCHSSTDTTVTAAIATHKRACTDCHAYRADRHEFGAGSVDYSTACAKCHWPTTTHYIRYVGDSCNGSRCHPGWPDITNWYMPQTRTAYGRFTSQESVEATPGALHRIHVNGSWVAQYLDGSRCEACHAPAACDACHVGVQHGSHGSARAGAVSVQTYKAAYGATNIRPGNLSVSTGEIVGDDVEVSTTCAAPECHDRSKAATSAFKKRCADCHWPYE